MVNANRSVRGTEVRTKSRWDQRQAHHGRPARQLTRQWAKVALSSTEIWTLSPDGRTLTIDAKIPPSGPDQTQEVFRKRMRHKAPDLMAIFVSKPAFWIVLAILSAGSAALAIRCFTGLPDHYARITMDRSAALAAAERLANAASIWGRATTTERRPSPSMPRRRCSSSSKAVARMRMRGCSATGYARRAPGVSGISARARSMKR